MKLLISICLLIYTMEIFAQPAGTILFTVNKVIAEPNHRNLTRGSSVYTGDTIITAAGAKAQIKYTNGTLVAIQPNSNYQIVAYAPAQKEPLKAKLNTGALEYTSSGKKKGVLKTPVVALAILGTHFQVIAAPTQTYLNVTQGAVQSGNTVIGPGHLYSSGSINNQGMFTPGAIPWQAAQMGNIGSTQSSSKSTSANAPLPNSLLTSQVASTTVTATNTVSSNAVSELAQVAASCHF